MNPSMSPQHLPATHLDSPCLFQQSVFFLPLLECVCLRLSSRQPCRCSLLLRRLLWQGCLLRLLVCHGLLLHSWLLLW